MGQSSFCFLICIVFPFIWLSVHADKRREECHRICKGIRFPGNIGGCKCNIVLFTKRSSESSKSMDSYDETLKQLKQRLLGKLDWNESTEDELDVKEKPERSTNSLIRLIESRILRPVMQDMDY